MKSDVPGMKADVPGMESDVPGMKVVGKKYMKMNSSN